MNRHPPFPFGKGPIRSTPHWARAKEKIWNSIPPEGFSLFGWTADTCHNFAQDWPNLHSYGAYNSRIWLPYALTFNCLSDCCTPLHVFLKGRNLRQPGRCIWGVEMCAPFDKGCYQSMCNGRHAFALAGLASWWVPKSVYLDPLIYIS